MKASEQSRHFTQLASKVGRQWRAAGGDHDMIKSAGINGHYPYAYLKDVMTRSSTHRAGKIAQLLPRRWMPTGSARVYSLATYHSGRHRGTLNVGERCDWSACPSAFVCIRLPPSKVSRG